MIYIICFFSIIGPWIVKNKNDLSNKIGKIVSMLVFFVLLIAYISDEKEINKAKTNDYPKFKFDSNVLTVTFNEDILGWNTFKNFIKDNVCKNLKENRSDFWKSAKISKVEAFNNIEAQGYSFENLNKRCPMILKLDDENSDKLHNYLYKRAKICIAGSCRDRKFDRDEHAVGDNL